MRLLREKTTATDAWVCILQNEILVVGLATSHHKPLLTKTGPTTHDAETHKSSRKSGADATLTATEGESAKDFDNLTALTNTRQSRGHNFVFYLQSCGVHREKS